MRRLAGWRVLLRPGGCKAQKDTGGQLGLQWILNERENKCYGKTCPLLDAFLKLTSLK